MDRADLYKEWRRLVNITPSRLERFLASKEGREAGLSRSDASAQGIRSGRDSARAILRMKRKPKSEWTDADWKWAKRQVAFIKRMRGAKGPLFKDGKKTRKHTSLLLWGHDPMRRMRRNAEKFEVPDPDDPEVTRNVLFGHNYEYRLMVWETGRPGHYGKNRLGYALYVPGSDVPLFAGEDYETHDSPDSDEMLHDLLGFFTLASDTEDWTPAQRAFLRRAEDEGLSMWADEEDPPPFREADDEGEEITEEDVLQLAEAAFPDVDFSRASEGSVHYEHGQWWVLVWDEDEGVERTFSVVDSSRGLDLEETG